MSAENKIPKFLLNITTMPKAGYARKLLPNDSERDEIAASCGLTALSAFEAIVECKPWHRDGVRVFGHITAEIEQACAVSLEPVFSTIDTEFSAHFVPEGSRLALPPKQVDGEIVFEYEGEDAPDVVEGEELDLWEVMLEYFNLEIDPFPRAEGQEILAEFSGETAPEEVEDDQVSPFAVLAELKRNDS
ncbi:MAG: DUF177 domain-containing protein [Rhizobiaceae bacterium]